MRARIGRLREGAISFTEMAMAEESKLAAKTVSEKLPVSPILDEAALERSEPRLKLALQATGGGVWDWDFTTGKAWWSDEMYDLSGVERGSPVELEVSLARVHDEDRELVHQAMSRAIAERTGFQTEVRICHPVLGERWVATVGRPVRDGAGQVTRLVGITLDVTARRHVEDALRASNERLELLATVGESLLRAEDPQVIIEQVCRKVMSHLDCQLFFHYVVAVPGRQLRIHACAGIVPEAVADITELSFGTTISGCVARDGQPIVAEDIQHSDDPRAQLVRSYGMQAYCCHPLLVRGRVIGTLSFGTRTRPSFTKNELALMKSVADLVAVAVHRRRTEEEREQLIARLEAQNAELERFTYTVSHDLKSPLITIKGYIGMLGEELADTDVGSVQDDLMRISRAADRMVELLEDLLELSRIGRLVNPPEDVSLDDLVQEALQIVGAQIESKGIRVKVCEPLPVLYGDRLRLLEVLQNLVENAAKYMGDNIHPRIEIGVRRDDSRTICYVRDNGIGIDPRFHEKIFGLFDQLDPKAGGTGIGLAIVKRIIEVHGGRVWVESEGAGRGSTFCFTVPGRPVPQEGKGSASALHSAPDSSQAQGFHGI